jgi:integrase
MIATLAATGLRNGEIGGLTVDRVDFLRRTVTVDRQLVGTALREPRFGPPKTKASNRVIPVPAALVETMAAHLSEFPSETVVFRTAHGSPWTRKTLNGEWRDWLAKAAVAFNPHDLRHFYASGLIAAGLSPKVIQARLGHATITETMDTYGHLWPDDEDRTRDAAGALLEGISRTADGLAARKSWSQA